VTRRPLILILKSIIERSYGMQPVIGDLTPFIIGDAGYRALYGETTTDASNGTAGARLMVRQEGSTVRAAVYYPDALVRHLEQHDPRNGVGDDNIDAFAALVEELDHLLALASRAAEGRPVTLLEMECHADVTKYLLVLHFLGKQTGRRRLSESHRCWARHHLFERYAQEAGEEGARYRHAARLARRYVSRLDAMSVRQRHAELRALQRRPFVETQRILEQTC
jgi:hypothetical protein